MRIHRNIEHLPPFRKAVITIGSFDGVHQGHQKIISMMKSEAQSIGGETIIITFDPHPRKIVAGGIDPISLLTSIEEKAVLFEHFGIDHMVIVPFTGEFSKMSPEIYVESFLVQYFRPSTIIVGYDHRFGMNRAGDFTLLEKLGSVYNFKVVEIPEHVLHSIAISSTHIRKALIEGKLEEANEYLGYPFLLEGKVVYGDKKGRTIGFPTANLGNIHQDKLIPLNGVYAVKVRLHGHSDPFIGMMNIGVRPTLDGQERRLEVHIINFQEELYGKNILIQMFRKIREEKKFNDFNALKVQIEKDREEVLQYFAIR